MLPSSSTEALAVYCVLNGLWMAKVRTGQICLSVAQASIILPGPLHTGAQFEKLQKSSLLRMGYIQPQLLLWWALGAVVQNASSEIISKCVTKGLRI